MNRNNKKAVNNTGVKKQYRWINDIEPVFMEDSKRNYGHRTCRKGVCPALQKR